MRKTYITSISLQGKGDLLKPLYEPKGFKLKRNRESSFPIIPVIADKQETGDDVKIIAIRSANGDTLDNYAAFLKELSELGIEEDQVAAISIEENQSDSVCMDLLMKTLDEIPDESLVYGDITFGTKPMSAIVLYAMRFVEKIKDCEVEGIYYGEVPRKGGEMVDAFLYDLTILKLLGDVIDQLKDLGVKEIQEALNKIIKS